MKSQTVNQLIQLLVNGPLMVQNSGKLKNKYFKIAVGVSGVAISAMALYAFLKDKELEKQQAEKIRSKEIKTILKTIN